MIKFTTLIIALLLSCVSFASLENPPLGFAVQILEPTGGKILRPENWHYAETHQSSKSFRWTISKEDTENGKLGYATGASIQTFLDVEEKTKKTPEQFVRNFLEDKKRVATKIHSTCEAETQGLFTRICLETTEGQYHISYSCFWGNDIDLVVLYIAGAPLEVWDEHENTFNLMNNFQLIDMSRFDN